MKITFEQLIKDSKELAKKIPKGKYSGIYGIPAGGILPAYIIAKELNLPLVDNPDSNSQILIIDDLIDSGRTLENKKYKGFDAAVLYKKSYRYISKTDYYLKEIPNEWIDLPHDKKTDSEDLIIRMLEKIGENPNREGLLDTPKRVVKMWQEIFRGYDKSQKPKIAIFDNGNDGIKYDQMILDSGNGYSLCEHHMVPFEFTYHFAYIPNKKILGLSKVARIVDYYAAKLQIQERLVKEIVDELERELQPQGIALILKGRHLCKSMRGVKKEGKMITSEMRGVFKNNQETRNEFLTLIK